MTTIKPTNLPLHPPDLPTLLDAVLRNALVGVNCARVGVIQSFDAATQTATVVLAQKQVTSVEQDGTQTLADCPPLELVPVFFPSGGGFTLTFPVAAGDECLLLFNDRELDNWLINGKGNAPSTGRIHDIADAIAFVGLRSNPRALAGVSTAAAQLRSDDGKNFVEINAQGVKVHANTVYAWDVQGYGQKITWTGGNNFTIDNYTIGAVVTTNNHNIAPPVIP